MAAEYRKTRKSNFSNEEKEILFELVMQNKDILCGENAKNIFYKETRDHVWGEILDEINKVSRDKRTLAEVKNKWKRFPNEWRTNSSQSEFFLQPEIDELDAMPLQQRLSQNGSTDSHGNELQSQALSPTKLKVTRQAARLQNIAGNSTASSSRSLSPPPLVPASSSSQICLKWDSHHSNMQTTFPNLLTKEQYVDTTMVSEGKALKCHKMILSSCSPYFEQILSDIAPFQHPVLFMNEIPFWILKALCDFMYAGEVHISQSKLRELLRAAETLKIKGLATISQLKDESILFNPNVDIKSELETNDQQYGKNPEKNVIEETDGKTITTGKRREDSGRKSRHQDESSGVSTHQKYVRKIAPKSAQIAKETVKESNEKAMPKTHQKADSKDTKQRQLPKRNIKSKFDIGIYETDKNKNDKNNDTAIDFLELVKPVYEEEVTKDYPIPARGRQMVLKKTLKKPTAANTRDDAPVTKRMKKRRFQEYNQDRDESPSPTVQLRKGTRSRPNAKIPKYYDFHDTSITTTTASAVATATTSSSIGNKIPPKPKTTIIREPHTTTTYVDSIKSEPIDLEESSIVVEENMLVNYLHPPPPASEGEEIMGNYDSPIVNIKTEGSKSQKIAVPNPVIMNVHTVMETDNLEKSNRNEQIQKDFHHMIDMTETDEPNQPNALQDIKPTLIKISNVESLMDRKVAAITSLSTSGTVAKPITVITATGATTLTPIKFIKKELVVNDSSATLEPLQPPAPTVIDILSSSDDEASTTEAMLEITKKKIDMKKKTAGMAWVDDMVKVATKIINKNNDDDGGGHGSGGGGVSIKSEPMDIDAPTLERVDDNESSNFGGNKETEMAVLTMNQREPVADVKSVESVIIKKEISIIGNDTSCPIELQDDDDDDDDKEKGDNNLPRDEKQIDQREKEIEEHLNEENGTEEQILGMENPIELKGNGDSTMNVKNTNIEQVDLINANTDLERPLFDKTTLTESAENDGQQSGNDKIIDLPVVKIKVELEERRQLGNVDSPIELKDDDDDDDGGGGGADEKPSVLKESTNEKIEDSYKLQQPDESVVMEKEEAAPVSPVQTILEDESEKMTTDDSNNKDSDLEIIDCDLIPETNSDSGGNKLISIETSNPTENRQTAKILIKEHLSIDVNSTHCSVIVPSPTGQSPKYESFRIKEEKENHDDDGETGGQEQVVDRQDEVQVIEIPEDSENVTQLEQQSSTPSASLMEISVDNQQTNEKDVSLLDVEKPMEIEDLTEDTPSNDNVVDQNVIREDTVPMEQEDTSADHQTVSAKESLESDTPIDLDDGDDAMFNL